MNNTTKRGGRHKPGSKSTFPPDKLLRGSQIVTTYGPGALCDLVHRAVIVGGMDGWWNGIENARTSAARGTPIEEVRLCRTITYMMRGWGRDLRDDAPFVGPPKVDEREPDRNRYIKVYEFPNWLVCQNPRCRALLRLGGNEVQIKGDVYEHDCGEGPVARAVPVRFVAACPAGHIEDFPWERFVHTGRKKDEGAEERIACRGGRLSLEQGPGGDLSDVFVHCRGCGSRRSMRDAQTSRAIGQCRGRQPWLGKLPDKTEDGVPRCSHPLEVLVRQASNAYFPCVASAISIPPADNALDELVARRWINIQNFCRPDAVQNVKIINLDNGAFNNFTDAQILAAMEKYKTKAEKKPEPIKVAEWKKLLEAPALKPHAPSVNRDVTFSASKAPVDPKLPPSLSLTLVHKLREVRVLIGFTRLSPAGGDMLDEADPAVVPAAVSSAAECLPAMEMRGEGIFFRLDEEAVRAWEARPEVQERARVLARGNALRAKEQGSQTNGMAFRGVRFYLLHSLSHLLISAISMACGYAASAIRERLYCSNGADDDTNGMAGILLATGSPSSEGTLGGLVDQYRQAATHLAQAKRLGQLCSNDPICALHRPDRSSAERFLEGAACHGCLHLAECSCESFNQYLDRALVFPTLGHPPGLTFFGEDWA